MSAITGDNGESVAKSASCRYISEPSRKKVVCIENVNISSKFGECWLVVYGCLEPILCVSYYYLQEVLLIIVFFCVALWNESKVLLTLNSEKVFLEFPSEVRISAMLLVLTAIMEPLFSTDFIDCIQLLIGDIDDCSYRIVVGLVADPTKL